MTDEIPTEREKAWGTTEEWKALMAECGVEYSGRMGRVGRGWWPILSVALRSLSAIDGVNIEQIKEKFGGGRLYVSLVNNLVEVPEHVTAMRKRERELAYAIAAAFESASFTTCERCGRPGVIRAGGWLKCLCDEHSEGRAKARTWADDYAELGVKTHEEYVAKMLELERAKNEVETVEERPVGWTREEDPK